jgi:hypothetical protein
MQILLIIIIVAQGNEVIITNLHGAIVSSYYDGAMVSNYIEISL